MYPLAAGVIGATMRAAYSQLAVGSLFAGGRRRTPSRVHLDVLHKCLWRRGGECCYLRAQKGSLRVWWHVPARLRWGIGGPLGVKGGRLGWARGGKSTGASRLGG
jgi:hypothetical protein